MSSAPTLVVVKAAYDEQASVWYVESSDIPGLNIEASSLDDLRNLIPAAILDLLEAVGDKGPFDIPIEIVAHASARARGGFIAA